MGMIRPNNPSGWEWLQLEGHPRPIATSVGKSTFTRTASHTTVPVYSQLENAGPVSFSVVRVVLVEFVYIIN